MHENREQLVAYIRELIARPDYSLAGASKAMGRNLSYLHQFLGPKASPKVLPEDERARLAAYLGVPESNLRVRPGGLGVKGSVSSPNETRAVTGALLYGRNDQMVNERLDLIEDIANLPTELLPTVRALVDRIKGLPGPQGGKSSVHPRKGRTTS